MLYWKKIDSSQFLKIPGMRLFLITSASVISFFVFVYACFHSPKLYPLWTNLGLDRIATFINPGDPNLFFQIGENSFGHGKTYNIKKAESAYTKAIELRPDFLEAHYQLGRIHFINSRFQSALSEIAIVLRINPEFKKAYYMHGLINGYKGNLVQAEYGFQEFIKRDSLNWAGYNDLAWIYFKQGDFLKTRDTAKSGLEQAPKNPWLNNIYGTALMNLGDQAGAKQAFELALAESEQMTGTDWGRAYPGNNPNTYETGIQETRSVIQHNLSLVDSKK